MEIINGINGIIAIIALASAALNVSLFFRRSAERQSLRSHMQTNYNIYYNIARACSRFRLIHNNGASSDNEKYIRVLEEVSIIRGVVDTARSNIISFSREHLAFSPQYEHPAHPGKFDWPDEVKMGTPPEEIN